MLTILQDYPQTSFSLFSAYHLNDALLVEAVLHCANSTVQKVRLFHRKILGSRE